MISFLTYLSQRIFFCIGSLTVASSVILICYAQTDAVVAGIPQNEITALQAEFTEIKTQTSASKKRRSCKTISRRGESLIEAAPQAPNRFQVLSIMFQSQKLLLEMDNTERNRKNLIDISIKLAQAPDAFADLRLEADLLSSNMELDAKDASKKERVEALTAMIARYKNTPAEAKCLMVASLIARKIESRELEQEIVTLMTERFAGDPEVVQFRLNNLGFGRADVPFSGNFKRTDGTTISFPVDQLGHTSIVVFWSNQMPGFETELKKIQEKISPFLDQLSVFSFNMDTLPDAGGKQLRSLGLNWTALDLPDGKNSRLARIFGDKIPYGYLVNAHGHTLLMSSIAKHDSLHGKDIRSQSEELISDELMPHPRGLAQLQSLFIGDFLVTESKPQPASAADSLPQEKLAAIQACFTPIPMRYQLTPAQALAGYTDAEKLCREAITQFPKASDLWRVQNYRIIALLGMWKMAIEPKHLDAAVAEARGLLPKDLPKGADVVSRFCLAQSALRVDGVNAKSVITEFIDQCGGDAAPDSAHAAAVILSLDAHSKELLSQYRQKFLEIQTENDPMLWPVANFLYDRYHSSQLMQATDSRQDRQESRSFITSNQWITPSPSFPATALKTLDGGTLNLPKDTEGKLTLVIFVEPPAGNDEQIPIEITGTIAAANQNPTPGIIGLANQLAAQHAHGDVEVVVAFLSEDTARIQALVKKHGWKCQIAMVPGGLSHPLVRKIGVVSADRIGNIYLLRGDGSTVWHTTGLRNKFVFGNEFSAYLGMSVQIEICDITRAYKALEQGDFKQAADYFASSFPEKTDERFGWNAPRYHARALANMKLELWDAALGDIDKAIASHDPKIFGHNKDSPSESVMEMRTVRAIILEKLGRKEEAKEAQTLANLKPTSYQPTIYSTFHANLKKFRQKHFPTEISN